jgi:hypothetical protein
MVKIEIYTATDNRYICKNGSFTRGREYLTRDSKCGQKIVMLSNEGYWIPMARVSWGLRYLRTSLMTFDLTSTYFVPNRKAINKCRSVMDFYADQLLED